MFVRFQRRNSKYCYLLRRAIYAPLFVYFAVVELKPQVAESTDSSPMLSSWMVYALAFSIVYSLIAWPCVIRVCGKRAANAES